MKSETDDSGLIGLPPPETLPDGLFAGREVFRQMVRDAFSSAARDGWHEMIICDPTFEDWPLRELSVVSSLHAWAKSGRQLTMLATSFDGVARNQPRFVAFRKTWSHIIECRRCRTLVAADFPSAIWSRNWVMQRLDPVRSAGVSGSEPGRRVRLKELLNEKIRASVLGFPATTLGL